MDIQEEIYNYISKHEATISNNFRNSGDDIKVHFTTFGNRAACKAVHEILNILDDESKILVLNMMKNKRVISEK
jgi:hypothetical protein